ncbi:MAG: YafY family protein [Anaerolineae bacterium]
MRADRLLSILLRLQAYGQVTAPDLAAELEVSERTIYRDIEALGMAGIPIYTQVGAKGGIFLEESYRVRLIGLSRPEVQSLFLGGAAKPLAELGLDGAVKEALLKLLMALPSVQRDEVRHLQERFYIDAANWFQIAETSPFFGLLQQAVWEDLCVHMDYRSVESEETRAGWRTVEAYALVAKANIWYLVARSTDAARQWSSYRLGRLHHCELLPQTFRRDAHFDLPTYWHTSIATFERKMLEESPIYQVKLCIQPSLMRFFKSFMQGRFTVHPNVDREGCLTVTADFYSLEDALSRVLGFGTYAEVLDPPALRDLVIETARAIVKKFDNPSASA